MSKEQIVPKDRNDAPAGPAPTICPCCGGDLQLTPAQRAGHEPVDCPQVCCGFNEARIWDLAPAPPPEPPAS